MFEIVDIQKFGNYVLKNTKTQQITSSVFQFFGVKPSIGDKLLLFDELLNKQFKNYTQPYSFEISKNQFDEAKQTENEEDLAALVHDNQKILLKRIYG